MDNGGHVVEAHMKPAKSKDGAFSMSEPTKRAAFSAEEHTEMMSHVAKHLGVSPDPLKEEVEDERGE